MDIVLNEVGYKAFLIAFRQADKDNAGGGGETEVNYTDAEGQGSATYYYKSPNFQLVGYRLGEGQRVNLSTYNHVSDIPSCSRLVFRRSLIEGAAGRTVVEKNLSRVIALTSEAARSLVVERNILKAITYVKNFDFNGHELLFKNYQKTTDRFGYGGTGKGYLPGWQPLAKYHYASYFNSLREPGTGPSANVTRITLL